ncbi:conserved protein, unknown function [Plasmodium knowlesi strain H]|uniref:Uncharacterized protein n=3 Tax=Plasmodium knowlesi TaxID=5850 RepID=A0A5K1UNI7_PLAKH|nr:uncharacterized protein PKNH_1421800 [Plasmodium knowlesi strain H]OTN64099.1 Uncharacterized protein PKNOH_S140239600 [Plasmodium knowlesi]CAA9990818.1 conserved protein, unknown function [Plasmodium knowlesi strain H]SBO21006.1 conserved protein, unknown function [Plasmodium knowlesi strain H]SBO21502.1 conserved protein, unknown function [Plasmodium knowlesi strain H]VVS80292.1 conserved protein, unknown function [Plasmodium knowlesi strain H]|eukprot:XP_002262106.1 [Plasmodium knowlesi strain H]
MGKGSNACKRNQARERKNVEVKAAKSQLKANKDALSVICKVCYTVFMQTQSIAQLAEHAQNKHNKDVKECFPDKF